jgi:hypothetical protein
VQERERNERRDTNEIREKGATAPIYKFCRCMLLQEAIAKGGFRMIAGAQLAEMYVLDGDGNK